MDDKAYVRALKSEPIPSELAFPKAEYDARLARLHAEMDVRGLDAPKVVIDHHQSQDDLGALRLVDTGASACGMLAHEAFAKLKGEVTPKAASALFVAVAMDTGWMHHSNTTPEVLHVLAESFDWFDKYVKGV